MSRILWFIFFVGTFVRNADFHGMLLEPVNRASRWRFDSSAPMDYNDNEGFCGGYYNQWTVHSGKCGLCGDDYGLPIPRPHEFGGFYGNGTIVKTYKADTNISISVLITANHLGYFVFDMCNMDSHHENEECFDEHLVKLASGEDRFIVGSSSPGWFNMTLLLPRNVTCTHCVLRWTYVTGNFWGTCENGAEAMGCGPQENFRSCSDISIVLQKTTILEDFPEDVIQDYTDNNIEDIMVGIKS